MANIKSAKKRIKVIETKTLRNKMIKSKADLIKEGSCCCGCRQQG